MFPSSQTFDRCLAARLARRASGQFASRDASPSDGNRELAAALADLRVHEPRVAAAEAALVAAEARFAALMAANPVVATVSDLAMFGGYGPRPGELWTPAGIEGARLLASDVADERIRVIIESARRLPNDVAGARMSDHLYRAAVTARLNDIADALAQYEETAASANRDSGLAEAEAAEYEISSERLRLFVRIARAPAHSLADFLAKFAVIAPIFEDADLPTETDLMSGVGALASAAADFRRLDLDPGRIARAFAASPSAPRPRP